MTYSSLELAVSGEVVHALHALVSEHDCGLGVIAHGPASDAAGSLSRLVLGNHRLTAWAYGMCDGTLVLSLHAVDENVVEAARRVAPVTWKAGELRASGLQPAQVLAIIDVVRSDMALRCRRG